MSIDWRKVAADRLRTIRELRTALDIDRQHLAQRATHIMQAEIKARCLTSMDSDEWRAAWRAAEEKIAAEGHEERRRR